MNKVILVFIIILNFYINLCISLQWEKQTTFKINLTNNIKSSFIYNNNTNSIFIYTNKSITIYENGLTIARDIITSFKEIYEISIYETDLYVYGSVDKLDNIIKPSTSPNPSLEIIKYPYILNNKVLNEKIQIPNKINSKFQITNNDKIIFFENQQLIVYSVKDKKVQFKISPPPNNNYNFTMFQINEIENEIYLFDQYNQKILNYNLANGEFNQEIQLLNGISNEIFNKTNFIEIQFEKTNNLLYIKELNKIIGFKRISNSIFKSIKTFSPGLKIYQYDVSNINGLLINNNNNDIEFWKWIGSSVSDLKFVFGRIEIYGNGLLNTSKINDNFENQYQILLLKDDLIICNIYNNNNNNNDTVNNYKELQLQLQIGNDEILIEKLIITRDGCNNQDGYFYDEYNKICKKLKGNQISILKCKNPTTNNTISIINEECLPFWDEISNVTVDIYINRFIRVQECWNGRPLIKSTEIDVIPSIKYKNQLNENCKSPVVSPIIIDLLNSNIILNLNCFELFGTKNKIQSFGLNNTIIVPPPTCYITNDGKDEIILNKIEPWLYGSRCLNGIRYSIDGSNKCLCNSSLWTGDQCDEPICQHGFKLINITGECKCVKRKCKNNEIFDYKSCKCVCNLFNPYKCQDGNCSKSFSYCLNLSIQKEAQCNSTAGKPFKCIDGNCYSSPSQCQSSVVDCLFKKCCWNGKLITDKSPNCPILPNCPISLPYRCFDGSCKLSKLQCLSMKGSSKSLKFLLSQCPSPNEMCPDGSCMNPCYQFNGCSILNPIQCLNGECENSLLNCTQNTIGIENNLMEQPIPILKSFTTTNQLPCYIKPMETLVSIETEIKNSIEIFDINKQLISIIDIQLPRSNNLISIEPVADSYIRGIGFQNEYFSRENAIFSPILNITIPNTKKDYQLPFIVNITMKMINNFPSKLKINENTIKNFCLGFINTTVNQWECVKMKDNYNQLILLNNNGEIYLKGFTDHFTSFAILLSSNNDYLSINNGGGGGEKKTSNNGGGGGKMINISTPIIIATIFSVVGTTILIIIIGLFILSYKKHGSVKIMKKIYLERIKYKFKDHSFCCFGVGNNKKDKMKENHTKQKVFGTIIEQRVEKCVGDDD